jgi:hypothetical protein
MQYGGRSKQLLYTLPEALEGEVHDLLGWIFAFKFPGKGFSNPSFAKKQMINLLFTEAGVPGAGQLDLAEVKSAIVNTSKAVDFMCRTEMAEQLEEFMDFIIPTPGL